LLNIKEEVSAVLVLKRSPGQRIKKRKENGAKLTIGVTGKRDELDGESITKNTGMRRY